VIRPRSRSGDESSLTLCFGQIPKLTAVTWSKVMMAAVKGRSDVGPSEVSCRHITRTMKFMLHIRYWNTVDPVPNGDPGMRLGTHE
jgi:hypothetical protein